jgi:hypothetical protein
MDLPLYKKQKEQATKENKRKMELVTISYKRRGKKKREPCISRGKTLHTPRKNFTSVFDL